MRNLIMFAIVCSLSFGQAPPQDTYQLGSLITHSYLMTPFQACQMEAFMEWERGDGTIGRKLINGFHCSMNPVWWEYSFYAQGPGESYVPGTLVNYVIITYCRSDIAQDVITYSIY